MRLLIVILLLSVPTINKLHAQSRPNDLNLDQLIEEIFALQDETLNYEELYEFLFLLYQEPIDLNEVNPEELQATYLLSLTQLNSFFEHRRRNGRLISIYELQAIPGFDLKTIDRLLPFVTIQEIPYYSRTEPFLQRVLQEKNNMFLFRYERTLEDKKGYTPPTYKSDSSLTSRYIGSSNKFYTRFRSSSPNDYSIGFTAEKDAGEEFSWDTSSKKYGFDFWSFHFALQNRGKLKSLVIGDFQLQVGQGMLLGAGFAPGKGAETIRTIKRGNTGLRPYTSVIENGYFRGIAATVEQGKLNLTILLSNTSRDANVDSSIDSLDQEESFISSILASGLHRTPTEISSRLTIREQVIGANLNYYSANKRLTLGTTALYSRFSQSVKRTPRVYNQFEFNGNKNHNWGGYYSYRWQNMTIFGEAAISASGGVGILNGLMLSLSRYWEMSLLYRKYDRNFHTLYGAAFSENSRNINEEGVYLGLKFTPSRKLSFTAYVDQFRFPWLKYRVNAPSNGSEILSRLAYTPSRKTILYAQYRREIKTINSDEETNLKTIKEGTKQNWVFNLDHTTEMGLRFKSRVQFSNYKLGNSYTKGFVISQDINLILGKLRISSRIALFDTEDYDNRQYIYEKDVLYAFSIPAYYGRGVRNYLVLQYPIFRSLDLWLRLARTTYRDRDSIGSSLETIEGRIKTDIKCQIRYTF